METIARKKNKRDFIIIFLLIVISSSIFNLKYLTGFYQRLCFYPFLFLMYLYCFIKKENVRRTKNFVILWLICIITTISHIFTCELYHDQSIAISIKASIPYGATGICYFFLHKLKPSEKIILQVILYVSLLVFTIQLLQQLMPTKAIFGVETSEYASELYKIDMRNGFYRFRLFSSTFMFPILYLLILKMLRKVKLSDLILLICLLVSFYLFLTRQSYVAFVVGLVIGMIAYKQHINVFSFFLMLVVFILLLLYFYEFLFGDLWDTAQSQLDDESYSRFLSAEYFGGESIKDPFLFLFGNGIPGKDTQYGKFIDMLASTYGLYTSDVGFIGAGYRFGYIHVFAFICICFRILFTYRKRIPSYIKMTVIGMLSISIMIYPIVTSLNWIYWSIMLYICDLHINKSNLCCIKG